MTALETVDTRINIQLYRTTDCLLILAICNSITN